MKRPLLVLIALCLAVLCAASQTGLAAPPSKTGTKLAVSPSPCSLGGSYMISGSGFKVDGSMVVVTLEQHCDSGITYTGVIWSSSADSTGCFTLERQSEDCAGTYVVRAEQQGAHGRRASASTSFTVY